MAAARSSSSSAAAGAGRGRVRSATSVPSCMPHLKNCFSYSAAHYNRRACRCSAGSLKDLKSASADEGRQPTAPGSGRHTVEALDMTPFAAALR